MGRWCSYWPQPAPAALESQQWTSPENLPLRKIQVSGGSTRAWETRGSPPMGSGKGHWRRLHLSQAVQLSSHGDTSKVELLSTMWALCTSLWSVSCADVFARDHINPKKSALQKHHFSSQTSLALAQTPGARQSPSSLLLYQKATNQKPEDIGKTQHKLFTLADTTAHSNLLKDLVKKPFI